MTEHQLIQRASKDASIAETANGFLLKIPASQKFGYRLAQLDDYNFLPRRKFPHHSLTLSLRARASSRLIPGTWGFGVWNDPFVVSLGLGGVPFRLPALPNAAWFFHASAESHLSFTEHGPGSGFLAQAFRSPRFHPSLIPAGLALPFSHKTTRRLLGRAIEEEEIALGVDVTQWHEYGLEWSPKRVLLGVDNVPVLETPVSPRGPLGVVIWIDNQYAAFTAEGKIAFGVLEGGEEWIELQDIVIRNS